MADENLLRALRSLVREHGFGLLEAHLQWIKDRNAEEAVARKFKHRNPSRRRDRAYAKTS